MNKKIKEFLTSHETKCFFAALLTAAIICFFTSCRKLKYVYNLGHQKVLVQEIHICKRSYIEFCYKYEISSTEYTYIHGRSTGYYYYKKFNLQPGDYVKVNNLILYEYDNGDLEISDVDLTKYIIKE
jgi:hypothetical protein